jgi:hypothetical protein
LETLTLLRLVGVGLAAVAAAILVSGIRVRRHRRRLILMGARHGMGLLQGKPHESSLARARRFRNRQYRVRLKDVLVGDDDEGRFHFALRSFGRHRHHVLFALNEKPNPVEEFHVLPHPAAESKAKRLRLRRPRIRPGSDWVLDLHWASPRSRWLDGHSLGVAARVLSQTAKLGEEPGAVPMGVEIHGRLLLVHSCEPLRGDQLDRFADDAIRLRRQILQFVRSVEGKLGDRPGGSGPRGIRSSGGSRVINYS